MAYCDTDSDALPIFLQKKNAWILRLHLPHGALCSWCAFCQVTATEEVVTETGEIVPIQDRQKHSRNGEANGKCLVLSEKRQSLAPALWSTVWHCMRCFSVFFLVDVPP